MFKIKQATLGSFNQSLLYPYHAFTTFRVESGKVLALDRHLERLKSDAEYLFLKDLDLSELKSELALKLKDTADCVLRITIYAEDFSPFLDFNKISYSFSVRDLPEEKIIKIRTTEIVRAAAEHKVSSYLEVYHNLLLAKKESFDDFLAISDNKILEGSFWNIFFLKEKLVVTPELNGKIFPGITRDCLIACFKSLGYNVEVREIDCLEISSFNYVFASNASFYLRSISKINDTDFEVDLNLNKKLINALKQVF